MIDKTPYIVGRRASIKQAIDGSIGKSGADVGPCGVHSIRAEDSGNDNKLRVFGWSTATFGAGAILGWLVSGKVSSDKNSKVSE